jgi:hypothetical protein
MKNKFFILCAVSITLNIVVILMIRFQTPFFNETHHWTNDSMQTGGILVFSSKEQQDLKKFVQYYNIRCELFSEECSINEITLSDRQHINSYLFSRKAIEISYERKIALIPLNDCLFTVSATNTTFNCSKGNETGTLGSHIDLYYNLYSLLPN